MTRIADEHDLPPLSPRSANRIPLLMLRRGAGEVQSKVAG